MTDTAPRQGGGEGEQPAPPPSPSHRARPGVEARLRAELDRLPPRRRRAALAVWRAPGAVLVPGAGLVAATVAGSMLDGDGPWFRRAGLDLFTADALDVYASSWLQIGPVYLAVAGALTKALAWIGSEALLRALFAAAQAMLVVWWVDRTVARVARSRGTPVLPARWAVGLVAVAGGVVAEGAYWGHPEEVLLALLLVEVAVLARAGAAGRAGVLLGLAVGIKQWAVIGAGALVPARHPRRVVLGAGVAALVAAACYAPFVLLGEVRTLDHTWGFSEHTLLGWAAVALGTGEWVLRAVQGGVAASLGALAAWRRPLSPALCVLVAVGVRVVLDPYRLPYYACPVVVLACLWVWTTPRRAVGRLPVVVLATSLVVLHVRPALPPDVYWGGLGAAVVALLVVAWRAEREPVPGPPAAAEVGGRLPVQTSPRPVPLP